MENCIVCELLLCHFPYFIGELPIDTNSPSAIRARFSALELAPWPVLAFLPARLVFAFIAQGLAAGLFFLSGADHPWTQATAWWPVYITITDVLCLVTLGWLSRREHIRILDLFGATGREVVRQLAWTPVYLLAVAPGAIAANLITSAFYGQDLPPMISVVQLPPAGAAYTLLVWPVVWVITEELVYLGYLLPRLEILTGKTWSAVLLVVLFWGLQHLSMPFIPDMTYLVSRVLAAVAAISLFPVAFLLGRRRLLPLIGVHYIADLATAFLVAWLPLLQR